jgi:hypothetical protein
VVNRPGRIGAQDALALANRLTDRDRQIALDCYDHRVLTTEQLCRLHFTNGRTAQRRLRELYALRVLDRVRPPRQRGEGSAPWHWLLDEAGAHLVAAQLGRSREELHWRHDTALALATSNTLAHQLAANELFTRLAQDTAAAGGALAEWWGERRLRETLGQSLVPDGYGRLELADGRSLSLLLELDRGSESLKRLRDKVDRYPTLLAQPPLCDPRPIVLICVPSAARQACLEPLLSGSAAPIHSCVWTPEADEPPLRLLLQHAT